MVDSSLLAFCVLARADHSGNRSLISTSNRCRDPRVARNRQSYYTRETRNGPGAVGKVDARRRVRLLRERVGRAPREREDRRVVGLPLVRRGRRVVSRMARSHDSHTRSVPCVYVPAHTGARGDEREGRRRMMMMTKERRRREGGKGEEGDGGGRGTPRAVYYRGSVPRNSESETERRKTERDARWTRAGAEARRKGERERPNYVKRDVGRRGWDS